MTNESEDLLEQYRAVRSSHNRNDAEKYAKSFLATLPNHSEFIESRLKDRQYHEAIGLMVYMESEDLKPLFPKLLDLASYQSGYVGLIRWIILRLPKEWIMARISNLIDSYLEQGTEEEYRRFLELYILIDSSLTQALALRALRHPDKAVQEAGSDFLEILSKGSSYDELFTSLTGRFSKEVSYIH